MSDNMLGRYKIIREIGRSNDVVYEAVDSGMNRRVALKELLLPQSVQGMQRRERVDRFYREARAAGSLTHPNIVTIYEAGEDRGRHFIAMEFLEGQSLRNVLDMERCLSVDRTLGIVKQICSALSYAHSRGVVHRDIKPENIQILPSGSIKITDFGIARIMEEPTLTADGQVFGTPSYMSPEQISGRPLDNRSDIFSLGVVIYEMLAGHKPFEGNTVVTITYNIMNQEVTYPTSVPYHMERVINRALAKDPQFRYSTADELFAELENPGSSQYQDASAGYSYGAGSGGAYAGFPQPSQPPALPQNQMSPPMPSSADPFGGLRPGVFKVKKPSRPPMSADTIYFVKVLLASLILAALIAAFLWVLFTGFSNYTDKVKIVMDPKMQTMEEGRDLMKQKSYKAAIEKFEEIINTSSDPNYIDEAKRNIAIALVEQGLEAIGNGDTAGAMALYEKALEYDSEYAEPYNLMGDVYYGSSDYDNALLYWKKAIDKGGLDKAAGEARRKSARLYIDMGDKSRDAGEMNAAVEYWRKAMDIAPGTKLAIEAQNKIAGTFKSNDSDPDKSWDPNSDTGFGYSTSADGRRRPPGGPGGRKFPEDYLKGKGRVGDKR